MISRLFCAGLFFLLTITSTGALWAKTMYITDRIEVGVRSGPGLEQRVVGMVKTGERVEVLEGDKNYVKIKTHSGTTGWISRTFLIDQIKSNASGDAKMDEELQNLRDTNQGLAKQQENLKEDREKLRQELEQSKQLINTLQQEKMQRIAPELNELKALNSQLENQISTYKKQVTTLEENERILARDGQIKWFLAGSGVLLLGILMGVFVRRNRKKPARYY